MTPVDICNMALRHVGITKTISSIGVRIDARVHLDRRHGGRGQLPVVRLYSHFLSPPKYELAPDSTPATIALDPAALACPALLREFAAFTL